MTNPQARNRMQRRRVMRTLLLCGLCLLGAGVARASAQNAVNGTIRGRVIDETSELGIASVLVEFLDSYRRVRASAMTDDDGEFLLSRTPRGSFRIRVTRLGYARTVTPVWEVESGETLTVIVRMHPDAVLMAPLEITASTRSASPVMANFYHRLQRGVGGVYITRADIEQRNPGLVTTCCARCRVYDCRMASCTWRGHCRVWVAERTAVPSRSGSMASLPRAAEVATSRRTGWRRRARSRGSKCTAACRRYRPSSSRRKRAVA
jgi:hypothetical protein